VKAQSLHNVPMTSRFENPGLDALQCTKPDFLDLFPLRQNLEFSHDSEAPGGEGGVHTACDPI
jgi:hypothetical protein